MLARFRSPRTVLSLRKSCYLLAKTLPGPCTILPSASQQAATMASFQSSNGDLNNISAVRPVTEIAVDPTFARRSLAIPESEDDHELRQQYRPFLLPEDIANSDWIANLELSTVIKLAYEEMQRENGGRLKVLVLYGSLRQRCVPTIAFLLYDLTNFQLLLQAPVI
jgi:hypothetical protein